MIPATSVAPARVGAGPPEGPRPTRYIAVWDRPIRAYLDEAAARVVAKSTAGRDADPKQVTVRDALLGRPKDFRVVQSALEHSAEVALRVENVRVSQVPGLFGPGSVDALMEAIGPAGRPVIARFLKTPVSAIRPSGSGNGIWLSGALDCSGDVLRIRRPVIWPFPPPAVVPLYNRVKASDTPLMHAAMVTLLAAVTNEADDLPPELRHGFLPRIEALRRLHRPRSLAEVADPAAVERLALDELAARIVAAGPRVVARGRSTVGDERAVIAIVRTLGFELTDHQVNAFAEIRADLASPNRMKRLLIGDVGSGKTVVALIAMATVAEAGRQAALMAPTEILARQHYERLKPFAAAAGLRVALLTGREKGEARERLLSALADGAVDIAIGTHTLLQADVTFTNLALAVVDEQHRFGVQERQALSQKGDAVDLLGMTATPIPRTLVMATFGDVDVSALRGKPPSRQPVDTCAIPLDRIDEVVTALGRAVAGGARVFWVCPLVNASGTQDVAAVSDRYEALRKVFGEKVGLLHGKMSGRDKDTAMAAFARGDTDILVTTTVIEVGVDVPQATVMVIEHAERFGLAQLHQLRGRVGRGSGKSTCLLLFKAGLGEVARARIDTMRRTEDGFEIAEEDLRLRGEGDVLGSSQSGVAPYAFFDIRAHAYLLEPARLLSRVRKP